MSVLRARIPALSASIRLSIPLLGGPLTGCVSPPRPACCCLQAHEEDFAPFVEDDVKFADYVKMMRKDGMWAGNIELQALSMALKRNICIHRVSPFHRAMSFHAFDSLLRL